MNGHRFNPGVGTRQVIAYFDLKAVPSETVVETVLLFSRGGEIGRRAGFRDQCPLGRGGSSPPSGTRLTFGRFLDGIALYHFHTLKRGLT